MTQQRAKGGSWSAKLGSALVPGTGTNEGQSYAPMQDAAPNRPRRAPGGQLAFDSYIDAETYGGTESVDGGRVEISMNGDEWIRPRRGYGTIIVDCRRSAGRTSSPGRRRDGGT
jgi:hypothetical protein